MSTHDSLTPFILLGKMQHFTDKKTPEVERRTQAEISQ